MDKVIKELEEKKEKTDNLLEIWNKYQCSEKILYIPPTRETIDRTLIHLQTNRLEGTYSLNDCKLTLKYFKKAQEYYNNYDFIVTEEHYYNNFSKPEDIKKFYIDTKARNKLNEICKHHEDKLHELTDDNV